VKPRRVAQPRQPAQVALFGCPRSGTSWLGQLFNASEHVAYRYQPLFAYEFKDWFGQRTVDAANVDAFGRALLGARSDFVLQDLRPAKLDQPSHLVWKEVRYHQLMAPLVATGALHRLVYLHRAPVDVLNSWYLAPKEFRAGQDIHHEYLYAPSKNTDASEYNGLARWKQSMAMALSLHASQPDRVIVVSYDRLRVDPIGQLTRLYDALGLALSPQVIEFIDASTSRHDDDAYSVFRSQRCERRLPADIVSAIQRDARATALREQAISVSI